MKNDYKVRAQKFIEEFFPYIENKVNKRGTQYTHYVSDMCEAVLAFNTATHRRVMIDSGCSRTVFITSDYVVKIDRVNKAFCGNCQQEVRAYNFAKQEGFSHLFAEITPFKYKNTTFYIMPRIRNIREGRDEEALYASLNDEEYNFITSYFDDLHGGNFGFKNGAPVIVDYAWNGT